MATTYTVNALLRKPAVSDRGWDVPVNANTDQLDAVAAIGSLTVTPAELPSASLNVRVSPGTYRKSDGTLVSYAGTASFAVTLSATSKVWLTDAGVLTAGASFPAAGTLYVPLASVVAGATTVTSVTDARIPWQSIGSPMTSGAAQAAVGALTTVALTGSTGGTASGAVATITDAPTANAVASLQAQLANTVADLNSLKVLVNSLRAALVSLGSIKGSA